MFMFLLLIKYGYLILWPREAESDVCVNTALQGHFPGHQMEEGSVSVPHELGFYLGAKFKSVFEASFGSRFVSHESSQGVFPGFVLRGAEGTGKNLSRLGLFKTFSYENSP